MFEEFTSLTREEAERYMEGRENQGVRKVMADNVKEIGGLVLDVGCGRGIDAKRYDKKDYFGVDISRALIEVARETNPGYRFGVADARKLPFTDDSYDNVICKSFFEHLPSEEIALKISRELLRVCEKQFQVAWHTPPLMMIEKSRINKLEGHFGKAIYQNQYSFKAFKKYIPKLDIVIVDNFQLWIIKK